MGDGEGIFFFPSSNKRYLYQQFCCLVILVTKIGHKIVDPLGKGSLKYVKKIKPKGILLSAESTVELFPVPPTP